MTHGAPTQTLLPDRGLQAQFGFQHLPAVGTRARITASDLGHGMPAQGCHVWVDITTHVAPLQPCSEASMVYNQSINAYICSNEIHRESCQSFTKNHLFDDVLTVSTSPSMTTIQIAFDGELRHPHLLLAGSAKLLGSNTSQSVLSGDIATHGPLWCTPTHAMSMCISVPGGLLQRQPKPFRHTSAAPTRAVPRPGFKTI
jgi:hypothetical protein